MTSFTNFVSRHGHTAGKYYHPHVLLSYSMQVQLAGEEKKNSNFLCLTDRTVIIKKKFWNACDKPHNFCFERFLISCIVTKKAVDKIFELFRRRNELFWNLADKLYNTFDITCNRLNMVILQKNIALLRKQKSI